MKKVLFCLFILVFSSKILIGEDFWSKLDFDFKENLNLSAINPNNKDCYINTKTSMYSSRDFTKWDKVNVPFNLESLTKLKFTKHGFLFAIVKNDGLYRLSEYNGTWEKISSIKTNMVLDIIEVENYLFVGTINDELYQSNSDGKLWVAISKNTPISKASLMAISSDNAGNLYFASNKQDSSIKGIYKSTNLGKTWDFDEFYGNITTIVCNSENDIFIGTNNPGGEGIYICRGSMKYLSCNRGLDTNVVNEIFMNKNDEMYVSIGKKGVFYSNNYGVSWVNRSDGLSSNIINHFALDNNNYLYGTGENGIIYRSTNPMKTFKLIVNISPDTTIITHRGDTVKFSINCFTENNEKITNFDYYESFSYDLGLDFIKQVKDSLNNRYLIAKIAQWVTFENYPIAFTVRCPGAINKYTTTRIISVKLKIVDVEEEQDSKSSISPNPARDYITVSHSALDAESIEIFNIFGENTTPSNLSGLPPLLAN
jgi:hypothetical protein